MSKLGGNWTTKFMAVETNGLWEICVDSFGSPSPIGTRLSKRLPLPDYARYAADIDTANELIDQWNQWSQDNQPKTKRKVRGRK